MEIFSLIYIIGEKAERHILTLNRILVNHFASRHGDAHNFATELGLKAENVIQLFQKQRALNNAKEQREKNEKEKQDRLRHAEYAAGGGLNAAERASGADLPPLLPGNYEDAEIPSVVANAASGNTGVPAVEANAASDNTGVPTVATNAGASASDVPPVNNNEEEPPVAAAAEGMLCSKLQYLNYLVFV